MHPTIRERLDVSDAQFVEIPLLIEGCRQGSYDRVWVVSAGEEEQRQRLLHRYGDPAHVDRMLATQLPTRVKLCFSDLQVRTNVSFEHVRVLVTREASNLFGS
jgi:dephospho-CoA kinase